MRNISLPEGIYRYYAQDCIESCEVSTRQKQASSKRIYIMSRYQAPRYPSQHKSFEKRHYVYWYSESDIICKGNEKNDYSYLFHGLFSAVKIKIDIWAHKEDLLRPNTPFSSFLNLNSKLTFQNASLIFATSSYGLKSSILEKANHFFPKSLMEAPTW